MPNSSQPQVLITGGAPIGLQPQRYAKAVGVQPRTFEVFESVGLLGRILDAAIQMHGRTRNSPLHTR